MALAFPLHPSLRLIASCSLLLVLAACEEPPSDGRVHVTYWEKWTGAEGAALQATVDAYNASQTRYSVDLVNMAQIDRKLIIATAGGNPPDLAGIWLAQVASFADRGALMPLDDLILSDAGPGSSAEAASAEFLARYSPVYGDMCRHRGHVYAVVSTPSTVALHWNKALFREAGLDPEKPPRSLAELDEYARRLTKKHPETGAILQAGFLPQEPGWWLWSNSIWFGGSLLDANGEINIAKDPKNLDAFRWLKKYSEEYGDDHLRRFTSGFGSPGTPQAAFFAGKIGMVLQGVWYNNYITQFAPGLEYGVAPWPAANDSEVDQAPFTVAEADVIVIPQGARQVEGAWDFLRYLSSANFSATTREELAGMELLCYLQQKNSPLRHWSPFFSEHHPHPHIELFRKLAESPRAIHSPIIGIWPEYLREINTANDRVRLMIEEPEAALAYAQRRAEASWKRHRESVARQEAAQKKQGTVSNP